MSNIVPIIGDLSGLRRFWFARIRDIVLPFPEATGGIISDDIDLGSVAWSEGYCTRETGSEVGELAGSRHGDFHKKSISFFVPGNNPELKAMFDVEMKDERFIVLYQDNADNTILVGTPEEFLKFSYKFETGEKVASRRGYLLTFTSEGIKQDYYYSGAINGTPGGVIPACSPVSIYQDGVFVEKVASGGTYNYDISEFTLTLNFPAGSLLKDAYIVPFKGVFTLAALPANVTSFVLKRVRGTSVSTITSAPVSIDVEPQDVMYLEFVPTTSSLVSFVFRIDYAADVAVKTTSLPVGNYRYYYVINYRDQTISCIDTSTDTVIATIALPAGHSYRTGEYRPVNQCSYVFGASHYAVIDSDPASGTFNTVLTSGSTGSISYQANMFDPVTDAFYNTAGGTVHKFFPGSGVSTNISSWFGGSYTSGTPTPKMSFIRSLRLICVSDSNPGTAAFASIDDEWSYQRISGSMGHIKEYGGKLYMNEFDTIKVCSLSKPFLKTLASVANTGARLGGVAFVPSLNRAYFSRSNNAVLGVLDMATNLSLGTIAYAGAAWGSTEIRYSPYSGRIYAKEGSNANTNGITNIHVFDPASGAIGAKVATITVGNLESSSDNYGNQTWFNGLAQ